MSLEKVLPAVERTRRNAGYVITLIGLLLLAGFVYLLVGAGGVSIPAGVILLLLAAFVYLGLWLGFKRRLVLEIDRVARTYVVVRGSDREPSQPLDSLGPLGVSMREHVIKSGRGTRTLLEYAVHPGLGDHTDQALDLHVEKSPGRARVHLERLARAWGLPSQAYNGDVRRPEELDQPLHERLRDDPDAQKPPVWKSAWNVSVEPLSPGYALVSRHRNWTPLGYAVLIAAPALFMFGAIARGGILAQAREGGFDLGGSVFMGLLAVVALALLVTLARGAFNTFVPGTVKITPEGVSYRGSRIAISAIEEVSDHCGVEVIGDTKTVRVPEFFCPFEARQFLVQEIRARVIEMGPLAGSGGRGRVV